WLRATAEGAMIAGLYIAAAVFMAAASFYFAWRNRDVRKIIGRRVLPFLRHFVSGRCFRAVVRDELYRKAQDQRQPRDLAFPSFLLCFSRVLSGNPSLCHGRRCVAPPRLWILTRWAALSRASGARSKYKLKRDSNHSNERVKRPARVPRAATVA